MNPGKWCVPACIAEDGKLHEQRKRIPAMEFPPTLLQSLRVMSEVQIHHDFHANQSAIPTAPGPLPNLRSLILLGGVSGRPLSTFDQDLGSISRLTELGIFVCREHTPSHIRTLNQFRDSLERLFVQLGSSNLQSTSSGLPNWQNFPWMLNIKISQLKVTRKL
jgi:hypothetical protein